jgi:UDP-2,3-diacylglucosamine pyrophosphatase LpxH
MSSPKTLVISDVHLGSPVCKTDSLMEVLLDEKYDKLIINGDLLDNGYFQRYKKKHWKVLETIRKISKKKEVILIRGNHDKNSEALAAILGIEFVHEYEMLVNDKCFLFLHLDIFDTFIAHYGILTTVAERIYYFFQNINKPLATWLKRTSKTFLQVKDKIKFKALEYIHNTQYDAIFGGHVHYAEEYHCIKTNKSYYNTGSFCDSPSHYIIIDGNGKVILKEI